uniref:LHFPL tetraspan subfamily member 4b n=1 Tax=Sinocyclocheilus grahami TaxID=75366 RepID=A0A672KDC1_SINGR
MLPWQLHSSEVARLYQTEFIRSTRAVGMLWAVSTLYFAVIQLHYRGGGPAPPTGTLGLFEVCMETDWPVPECRGSLHTLTPLPAFQSPAVRVCMSLTMVWASVGCLCLFRFCNTATVYKICAQLQLTAGFCLALACVLFPDSWVCAEMRALCGERVSSFSPGNCSVHWAYILAMLGVLDAGILATLAFVLGNRQDALLPEDTKDVVLLINKSENAKNIFFVNLK